MATLYSNGFDDVIRQMDKIGLLWDDTTVNECLKQGGEISKAEWQNQINSRMNQHTGKLVSSIKVGNVKKARDGKCVTVSPQGSHEEGKRNAMVAFVLNYSSRYPKQNGFVEAADISAEPKITAKMQEIIDRKIQKIGE